MQKKEVLIPEELYKKIQQQLNIYGFKTVDEYVEFVLTEAVKEESEISYSEDEEEEVKERLKSLGYLE